MANSLANTQGRVREWIGPRIVPVFADEVQWDDESTYEPLMMVQNQGETFMSRQYVPAGAPLPNTQSGQESTDYWVHMSNWNAQVEGYREEVMRYAQEVLGFDSRIDSLEDALPISNFDSTATVKDAIDAIDELLPSSAFDSTNTVDARFDVIEADAWVTALRIAADAVTTAKIADENVTTAKIADENVTTAKIADENVTTAKIADENVTTAKIADGAVTKDKIADGIINRLQSEPYFDCIGRFMLGSSQNNTAPYYGRTAAQGACIVESNNTLYWVQATGPDDSNHLVVYNLSSGEVVYDGVFNLGHANGASYDGDSTVMFANSTNKTLVFLNLSNPASPIVKGTVGTPNAEAVVCACYIGETGKVAIVHGALTAGYNFNVTGCDIYTDETLVTLERSVTFKYDSNLYEGWQSVTCDGDHFYISHSGPETVVVLDMNGNVESYFTFNKYYGHIAIEEIECFWKYKNKYYVSTYNVDESANRIGYYHGTALQLATLLEYDPTTNEVARNVRQNKIPPNAFFSVTMRDITTKSAIERHNMLTNPLRYGFVLFGDVLNYLASEGQPFNIALYLTEDYKFGINAVGLNLYLFSDNGSHAIQGLWLDVSNIRITSNTTNKLVIDPMYRSSSDTEGIALTLINCQTMGTMGGALIQINAPIQVNGGFFTCEASDGGWTYQLVGNAQKYNS